MLSFWFHYNLSQQTICPSDCIPIVCSLVFNKDLSSNANDTYLLFSAILTSEIKMATKTYHKQVEYRHFRSSWTPRCRLYPNHQCQSERRQFARAISASTIRPKNQGQLTPITLWGPINLMSLSVTVPWPLPWASVLKFPRSPTWRISSPGAPWVLLNGLTIHSSSA